MVSERIHSTAIISKGAKVGREVAIGPYCTVGPHVVLHDRVALVSHVSLSGNMEIGEDTTIYPFASLGHAPQDLKYKGEPSRVEIGARNKIREYVTIQPGTAGGGMLTKVGDDCLFMVGAHVAHDCVVGNNVILANNATLGGHVHVGDHAIIGGMSAVHQFVRVGKHAIIGGMSGVEQDVIPYGSVIGERAFLAGLNLVGLKRRSFTKDEIHAFRNAYRLLFADEGLLAERMDDVGKLFDQHRGIQEILEFIRNPSHRALCLPKNKL